MISQGTYRATPETISENQDQNLQLDNKGNLRMTPATTGTVTGKKSSIGTSAVQITATSTKCTGVTVKSPSTNTVNLFVGPSTITNGSTDATDGYILEPGDGVFITVNDPSLVYAIAASSTATLYFIVCN